MNPPKNNEAMIGIFDCIKGNMGLLLSILAISCTQAQIVTTVAGSGAVGYADGTGTAATFNGPGQPTFINGMIYMTEEFGDDVRRVNTTSGVVTRWAGSTSGASGYVDATGTSARFNGPCGSARMPDGNLVIADWYNMKLRKLTISTKAVTTLYASANKPYLLAYDSVGNLYITEYEANRVMKLSTTNSYTLFVSLTYPCGVFVDPINNVYVSANHRILKYAKANTASASTTTIGTGTVGYLDGAYNVSKFYWPTGMDMDNNGNLFVADEYNHRIRMITPGLVVSTLAGSGVAAGTNAVGTAAAFNKPRYLTLSPDKLDLYVSDYEGHRLRKIKVCQPGTYYNSTTLSCSACPANTFNSKTGSIGSSSCIICGSAAASTPPSRFPSPKTPDDCLATGPAPSLSKRIPVYSQVIKGYSFTCNTDSYNNPYADCLNTMAKICNTADSSFDKTRCHTGVNTMFGMMNNHWQRVRKQCGQWSFTHNGITYPADPSDNCNDANSNLIANAFYIKNDGVTRVPVTLGLTESTNVELWSKVTA
jgi:hypothetical protein